MSIFTCEKLPKIFCSVRKAGFQVVTCPPFPSPVLSLSPCYLSLNLLMCFQKALVPLTARGGWSLSQWPQVMDKSLPRVDCKREKNSRVGNTVQCCLETAALNSCLHRWVSCVRRSNCVTPKLCSQPLIVYSAFCPNWDAQAKILSFFATAQSVRYGYDLDGKHRKRAKYL